MKAMRVTILAVVALLGACGRTADLKPAAGEPLPVRPLMAHTTPSANDLLTIPQYARPNRVDELVKHSQPREADPFDLPPPTGSAAPPQPAGTDPEPIPNDTGPATPK